MNQDKTRVWDLPTRLFHWSLVFSFMVAFVTADFEKLRVVHVFAGYYIFAAVCFRVLWGFWGTRYALFSDFVVLSPVKLLDYLKQKSNTIGHNPLGGLAIVAMLFLLAGITITGMVQYIGDIEAVEDLHEGLAMTMLAVIGVHVLGVLVHKEPLVGAMLTGYKKVKGTSVSNHAGIAVIFVVACLLFAVSMVKLA